MGIAKLIVAIAIGAVVGSGATWGVMKSGLGDASDETLRNLYEEPYSFMTGKQYLDTCVPKGVRGYSPYDVDDFVRVAASSQACWSFTEATIDTLRVMGAVCKNLDRESKLSVENFARQQADERMSGAGALARSLYLSRTCVSGKD